MPLIRLIPFAMALLVVGFLAPPPAVAQTPEIVNVLVDPSHFSPNGDGIQDVAPFNYLLQGIDPDSTAHVKIEIQTGTVTAPTGAVVKVLKDEQQTPGQARVEWDGLSTSGILQPDGYYFFVAWTAAGTDTSYAEVARVVLDTVAPQVFVVDVFNPYTPDIQGADSLARITVDLANIGNSDHLDLTFSGRTPGSGTETYTLNVTTNGVQVVGWDGRKQADGIYRVAATVRDDAGNRDTASGTDLNLDITPPKGTINTPASTDTNDYIRRLEGYIKDRSGIQSAAITVFHAADSSKKVMESLPCPCFQDSIPFTLDLPDSVAETDSLIVDLFLIDLPGHIGGSSTLFLVDTIPPPPPVFDALPASVLRPQLSYKGTATGADSVYIFLNGFVVNAHLIRSGSFSGSVTLGQGNNTLQGRAHDKAHNASGFSPGMLVSYNPAAGIIVPERFRQGDLIQVNLDSPADGVTVNIFTLRGRKIRTFQDNSSNSFYDFPWDLADDDGNTVGSGPYVFRVSIDMGDGTTIDDSVIAVVTR